jgi:N-acyl-D-amino-acid deacylase
MFKTLLDGGANVSMKTLQGENVLERYGFWNDPALVRMLLERGIDPAAKDARGHNALLFAASSDTVTPDVFALLLKNTPPTDARTAYGDDALQAAQRRADAPIAELLGGTAPAGQLPKIRNIAFGPPQIRAAASLSLELLAKSGPSVVNQRGCFSCHHQSLPSLAARYARHAGIAAGQIAETNRRLVYPVLQRSAQVLQHGAAPAGEAATVAWQLIGLASDGQPPDLITDLAVNYIAATQMPDGSWPERWGRPPLEYSPVSATAVAIRALDLYGFPSRRPEFSKRIARASAWLAKAVPAASEEGAMRLLGLVWGKAPRALIVTAARELASAQRPDGGWAQLPALPSDAYATGQAMVALRESSLFKPESPGFSRGVKYLLGTQEPDGSWHVRGRALPVLPLFESGFPHGRDQWISAAGTSWAVMALSLAVR